MSDSEDENTQLKSFSEIHEEIERCKKNPDTSEMFISGWDDTDQDVNVVKDPKGKTLYEYLDQRIFSICRELL